MSVLDQLRPAKRLRVIDLVKDAGLDVSDWANFDKGVGKAASNPKYCYAWAFSTPGRATVVNLWHEDMRETRGTVTVSLALREQGGVDPVQWTVSLCCLTDSAFVNGLEGRG